MWFTGKMPAFLMKSGFDSPKLLLFAPLTLSATHPQDVGKKGLNWFYCRRRNPQLLRFYWFLFVCAQGFIPSFWLTDHTLAVQGTIYGAWDQILLLYVSTLPARNIYGTWDHNLVLFASTSPPNCFVVLDFSGTNCSNLQKNCKGGLVFLHSAEVLTRDNTPFS